jgi:hypothetical protein
MIKYCTCIKIFCEGIIIIVPRVKKTKSKSPMSTYYSRYIRHNFVFLPRVPWESFRAQTFLYEYNTWSSFFLEDSVFLVFQITTNFWGLWGCIAPMCQKFTSIDISIHWALHVSTGVYIVRQRHMSNCSVTWTFNIVQLILRIRNRIFEWLLYTITIVCEHALVGYFSCYLFVINFDELWRRTFIENCEDLLALMCIWSIWNHNL